MISSCLKISCHSQLHFLLDNKEKLMVSNKIFQQKNAAFADPPKVVPRRNLPITGKTPKAATRSTQLITAKEMATLNQALKSSKIPANSEQHRLSLPNSDMVRVQSLESIPQSVANVTGNTTEKEQTGTMPTRKPKAPRPPIRQPSGAPKPPPQKLKPQVCKGNPLPLRGVLCAKFGKKGKILTNGEFNGPAQHVIFSKIKFKILALDAENKHILIFSGDGVFKKSFKVAFSDNSK